MKKVYLIPEIEVVECVSGTMIAASLEVEAGSQSQEEDFAGEAAGAVRGDWEHIWDGM